MVVSKRKDLWEIDAVVLVHCLAGLRCSQVCTLLTFVFLNVGRNAGDKLRSVMT